MLLEIFDGAYVVEGGFFGKRCMQAALIDVLPELLTVQFDGFAIPVRGSHVMNGNTADISVHEVLSGACKERNGIDVVTGYGHVQQNVIYLTDPGLRAHGLTLIMPELILNGLVGKNEVGDPACMIQHTLDMIVNIEQRLPLLAAELFGQETGGSYIGNQAA